MATLLVTGANRGIGLEHVRQALAAGEQVIATCRNPGKADQLRDLAIQYSDRLRIEPLNVADAASVDALARTLDGQAIDMLINNAGLYGGSWETGSHRQTSTGMDYALWEDILQINVIGAFRTTMALLPNILASDRKMIVMMSSDLGSIAGNSQGQSHAYRSSKAALNMLTKGLSIELADQGVTIISLAPGWTQTELGGPSATWPVDDSVAAQRTVLAGLAIKDSGKFMDLTGKIVPW